jgi:ribonuclease-3
MIMGFQHPCGCHNDELGIFLDRRGFFGSWPCGRVSTNRIEAQVEAVLSELEAALGHGFARPELLLRALTHRSLANERACNEQVPLSGQEQAVETGDNERLEFLGDAVLGLVVAEALFLLHPEWSEGELTRVRAKLVSREHMAEVAEAIALGSHLRLSRGEDKSGLRRKTTVLSNTMEAVLGALLLDGGLEPVRAFARRWVMGEAAQQLAEELRAGAALGNYKSALQEYLQAARSGTPVYRVKNESGPDHHKRFMVEVRIKLAEGEPGKSLARGMGSTKKNAEQDAARRALERLKIAAKKAAAVTAEAEQIEEDGAKQ